MTRREDSVDSTGGATRPLLHFDGKKENCACVDL